LTFEQSPPHERPHDATAELGLYRLGVGLENAIDDANVAMGVLVQRRAEPMDEGHRAGSRLGACPMTGLAQVSLKLMPLALLTLAGFRRRGAVRAK
jgi:hypothetical protein